MSHFSNALTHALEVCDITQTVLAKRSGIAVAQVNRYCTGGNISGDIFDRLIEGFPEELQSQLTRAFLFDQCPAARLHLVRIDTKTGSLAEDQPDGLEHLPENARRILRFLGSQSHKRPVMELMESVEKILKGEL